MIIRPASIDIKIHARDAVALLQALRMRQSILPSYMGGGSENEYGTWVDYNHCAMLVGYLTDKLSESIALGCCGIPSGSRRYWRLFDRAKWLITRWIWPFKHREIA